MISKEKAEFVRSLADENGNIEPADVIAAARDPSTPIHGEFNWNVNEAARAHWMEQARRLIRLVKIEYVVEQRTYSAVGYVVDPKRPPKSHRYIDLTMAAMDRDTSEQILLDEMARITAAIIRAREIAGVLGLNDRLDALLANVDDIVATANAKQKRKRKAKAKSKRKKPRRYPSDPEARV